MKTKTLVRMALLIAIGIALPQLLSQVPQIRALISPMHIPVLIAGLVLGPIPGVIVGVVTPLLSHVLFLMPMTAGLPGMTLELGIYGLTSGLFMMFFKDKLPEMPRIYVSLILAMLCGRIAGGLLNAFVLKAGNYSISMWVAGYITGTAVGSIAYVIFIPIIVRALRKAGLSEVK